VARRSIAARQEDGHVGFQAAVRPHPVLRFRADHDAAFSRQPVSELLNQPRHHDLVQDVGHLLLLEAAVDELARLVFRERGPLLETQDVVEGRRAGGSARHGEEDFSGPGG